MRSEGKKPYHTLLGCYELLLYNNTKLYTKFRIGSFEGNFLQLRIILFSKKNPVFSLKCIYSANGVDILFSSEKWVSKTHSRSFRSVLFSFFTLRLCRSLKVAAATKPAWQQLSYRRAVHIRLIWEKSLQIYYYYYHYYYIIIIIIIIIIIELDR